jgi:cytochrome bd ubiquinol oxidase subunit I
MSHETLLDLSRWHWALTAAFHITFPALTVGTSVFLIVCYYMYMRTDQEVWLRMFRFWRRIFGIGFALGVVSGIVLTFEFGLNWGRFAHDVGPIVGVIIAMEVATAFFLEAGFLGLLVPTAARLLTGVRDFNPASALVIALHDRQSPQLPWTPSARLELS